VTIVHLPKVALAIIEERKITHYLLAPDHPAGRAKAAFSLASASASQIGIDCATLCWITRVRLGSPSPKKPSSAPSRSWKES